MFDIDVLFEDLNYALLHDIEHGIHLTLLRMRSFVANNRMHERLEMILELFESGLHRRNPTRFKKLAVGFLIILTRAPNAFTPTSQVKLERELNSILVEELFELFIRKKQAEE